MMLDSRKEHILDFIVRDFVRTAIPVSSGRVSDKKAIGGGIAGSPAGSPATIRNIMLELDEEGYLYQPHTSAGRAPSPLSRVLTPPCGHRGGGDGGPSASGKALSVGHDAPTAEVSHGPCRWRTGARLRPRFVEGAAGGGRF